MRPFSNFLAKQRFLIVTIAVLVVLAMAPAYLRAYTLSGPSDAPTLLLGDTVIVNKAAFCWKLPYTQIALLHLARPKRGDLVQILRPDRPVLAFKRVIGLPGETVEIRDNRAVIDGRPVSLRPLPQKDFTWVPESHHMGSTVYLEDDHWVGFTPGTGEFRDYGPVKLADDEFLVLGDNRDISLDCRAWGPLKEGAIRGKVILIVPTGARRK